MAITLQNTNKLKTLAQFYKMEVSELRDKVINHCIELGVLFQDDYGINLVKALKDYDTNIMAVSTLALYAYYVESLPYWNTIKVVHIAEDCPECGCKMLEVGDEDPQLNAEYKECENCKFKINLKQ